MKLHRTQPAAIVSPLHHLNIADDGKLVGGPDGIIPVTSTR